MKLQYANLISNLGSKFFLALSSFICIPIILKFIGIEAYGLIGFFNILSTLFGLLDFGFAGALNREVASLSASSRNPQQIRNLVRSLEVVFWATGALIGCILITSVDFIAGKWITPGQLSPDVVKTALVLMSISLVSQWPFTIYSNVLMGIEKQVLSNALIVIFTAIRNFGGAFFLWYMDGNIQAYFLFQIAVNTVQTITGMIVVWKILPHPEFPARFDWAEVKRIRSYATGMSLLAVLSFFMMNIDKLILSKILNLDSFGYYVLAANFATLLYMVISPIFSTYFPRLTQLIVLNRKEELKHIYHEGCQIMSILLLPAALTIALFAPEILFLWTRNTEVSQKSYEIVRYLVIGTACNGLMNMPYALQLAHGITKYSVYQNLISVILLIPLTIWSALHFGIKGAVLTWVAHNIGCVIIMAPFFHYKFLEKDHRSWCLYDVFYPLIASCSVVLLFKWLLPEFSSRYIGIPLMGGVVCFAALASLLVTTASRRKIHSLILSRMKNRGELQ